MNDELFAELMESVREGGAILRGEKEASRKFAIEAPDVKLIRERYDTISHRENLRRYLGSALRHCRIGNKDGQAHMARLESCCKSPLRDASIAPHPQAGSDVVQRAIVS